MPIETCVAFNGVQLLASRGETPDTTLVAMKSLVQSMGLDWGGQHKKMLAHSILAKGISMMEIPSGGGLQDVTSLPLSLLPFWMATLHPHRIKNLATRARVLRYQRECADALFRHFFGKTMVAASGIQLSEVDRRAFGGIAKGVMHKALGPLAERLANIEHAVSGLAVAADPRVAAVEFRPMLDVLKHHGVNPKGRRALSSRCSHRICRWLIVEGRHGAVRLSPESGRYLFGVDAVADWLTAEGRLLIEQHKAAIAGQPSLNFPKPPRSKRK